MACKILGADCRPHYERVHPHGEESRHAIVELCCHRPDCSALRVARDSHALRAIYAFERAYPGEAGRLPAAEELVCLGGRFIAIHLGAHGAVLGPIRAVPRWVLKEGKRKSRLRRTVGDDGGVAPRGVQCRSGEKDHDGDALGGH